MLALAGQPRLHGYDACMVYWARGALWRLAGRNKVRPLLLLPGLFCYVEIPGFGFGV